MPASFIKRRILLPIRSQITRGADPDDLSRAFACGVVCGVFPILGTTGIVGTLFGLMFGLNQAVIHALHWLLYPAHVALIPVYIRVGERLFGADPIPFSIPDALRLFLNSPAAFFAEFGMSCIHCVSAWAMTTPAIALVVYLICRPMIRRATEKFTSPP